MLRRTGFAHREYIAPPPAPVRPATRRATYAANDAVAPILKENIVRSEPYRRLVAALPCINCQIEDHSQAAHPPPTGKGCKETDIDCFPLCAQRPNRPGCHWLFDNYKLIPAPLMREQAVKWAKQTRAAIRASGKWPKGLEDVIA